MGIYIEGLFIGSEPRKDESGYNILVSVGMDAYRIKVPEVWGDLKIGLPIKVAVKPTVYNGRLYLSGEIV